MPIAAGIARISYETEVVSALLQALVVETHTECSIDHNERKRKQVFGIHV